MSMEVSNFIRVSDFRHLEIRQKDRHDRMKYTENITEELSSVSFVCFPNEILYKVCITS